MAEVTKDAPAANVGPPSEDETFADIEATGDGATGAGRRSRGPDLGAHVGRYLVLSKLGAGAMGVVFAAYDPELDRKVAIKLLKLQGGEASQARARLVREAQALAKLSHGNVVAVHDVGVHAGQVFVAMEFVQGQTLSKWMRVDGKPRPWREVVKVFVAAGRGLAAAHAQGLIHRDFKPENVMIGDDGRVRVMDFGLARASEQAPASADAEGLASASGENLDHQLTQTGAMMGTPAYMAPEQFVGGDVTARSDQFAFCVALHEALYGQRPFVGESLISLAHAVMEGQFRELPRGATRVPGWLGKLVRRGLAAEPEQRFEDMRALLGALHSAENRRWRQLALAGLAAVGLVAASVLGYSSYDLKRRTQACADAGDEIDALWTDEARAALEQGLRVTELSYAQEVATKLTPWVDARASAWRSAATTACMNASVHERWDPVQLDKASWCLERRRLELATLISEMSEADPRLVEPAIEAASRLPQVSDCVDELVLAAMIVPLAPDLRGQIEGLRVDLSRANYLALAGDLDGALALARETLGRARALAWAPLVAEARLTEASLLERSGDHEGSERAAVDAYMQAARSRTWQIASAAALLSSQIVGAELGRPAEARLWAEHAAVSIALAGDPLGLDEAQRANTLGLVASTAGEFERAKDLHTQALGRLEAALGPEHPRVAQTLGELAIVYGSLGDHEQALALLERVLALRQRTFGPGHPIVAETLQQLGTTLAAAGRHADALASGQEALALRERAFGPVHPLIAVNLGAIGAIHGAMGEHREAMALLERALSICEQTLDPEHPTLARTLHELAGEHEALGEHEAARERYQRALSIWETILGPEHPDLGRSVNRLGLMLLETGELDQAKAHFERALSIWETELGPEHPELGLALVNLGEVYRRRGRSRRALELFERALALWEEALGPDDPRLADALIGAGRAQASLGAHEQARAPLERALALRTAAGVEPELADARFALAAALWDAPDSSERDRARASELALRAREPYVTDGGASLAALQELDAWLAEHPPPSP